MKRLAAMHDWPLLIVRALTAVRTAASRSALGITMNGSLPPSSSTRLLDLLARGARRRALPAPVLPVSVTAATRGSSMTRFTWSVSISSVWKQPSGKPARRKMSSMASAHCGTFDACLSRPDVAGHQRRRREPEHLPERKVPRHDREHRTDRLVGDPAPRRAGLDGLVGQEPLGVLGVVAAAQRALGRLLDGGLERLAHLGHHEPAERFLLGLEDVGGREHQPLAVGVAAVQGFHGKTTGSLSLTGKAIFRRPALPLHNNIYHVPFGDADAIEQQLCIAREVGNDIAAVVMEPIQGEAGAIVPPDDFWPRLRQLCDEYEVLLIADEVQTGAWVAPESSGASNTGMWCQILLPLPRRWVVG